MAKAIEWTETEQAESDERARCRFVCVHLGLLVFLRRGFL
ncbi:MAG: hypothetical protein ACI87A_001144, partial [Planctomycetota bacterium]